MRRFCQGTFPIGQAATIGVDFLIKNMEINGEKIKVIFNIKLFYQESILKYDYLYILNIKM